MVALACRSPCTVACMAQVCVLWQRAATATFVWEALAARYWLGPLAVLGGVSNDSCGMVSCVPVGMADGGVAGGEGALEAVTGADAGRWGALPSHMARDLMTAEHDQVPEEYRGMVDAYFKAIATRAGEERKP